jgi:mannose-1-phosphate guanylyltransferase/mannose-6-phosphate isomerase
MKKVIPVILCGGTGTRLWPLSRFSYPKQFISILGEKTLFQDVISRVQLFNKKNIQIDTLYVVTNEEHRFLALEQINSFEQDFNIRLLLEPVGRNTAPALTLAALEAAEEDVDSVLVVLPSDQLIVDIENFSSVIDKAVNLAAQGSIVVLGIPPNRPETGYGYIQRSLEIGSHEEFEVIQFVEKPNIERAKQFLSSEDFLWNAGIFVLTAKQWLSSVDVLRPDIKESVFNAWANRTSDARFIRPEQVLYEKVPAESIDYAVIEKCLQTNIPIKVLPLLSGWSDLGSWDSVSRLSKTDSLGNTYQGDVLFSNSEGSYVHSTSRLVAAVGLKNMVVVETPDAVLVLNKSESQDMKQVVEMLASRQRQEKNLHRKVYRPWGWYDSIDQGEQFKVKRIQVNPGASLSLQMHKHRAEHWVVVKGIAEITCGEKIFKLVENESTFISAGQKHRLSNPGNTPLEIIEVQSGTYLEEDDIVRLEDNYGRKM